MWHRIRYGHKPEWSNWLLVSRNVKKRFCRVSGCDTWQTRPMW